MANCAILVDVCRHVVRKDESLHGKFTVLLGFRPMCLVIWKGCCRCVHALFSETFRYAFYFPLC
jgi:hypothetical protein